MNKVVVGQKFRPKAKVWNSFINAAEYVKQRQSDLSSQSPRKDTKSGIILLKNGTGEELDQFAVAGLGALLINPEDNEAEFRSNLPVFEANLDSISDEKPFVILQKPAQKNELVPAMITGITPAKINITDADHSYASVDTGTLKSAETGLIRVLWKESGTGEKWAIIQLGAAAQSASEEYNGPFKVTYEGDDLVLLEADPAKGRDVENIIYFGLEKIVVPGEALTEAEGYVYLEIIDTGEWEVMVNCGPIPEQSDDAIYHPIASIKKNEDESYSITQIQYGIIHFPGRIF